NCEVLTTLTPDTGRILSKLHTVQPKGKITFGTGIRVAHVSFPAAIPQMFWNIPRIWGVFPQVKGLVKLAKRLKKEKVNVDIINFGEEGPRNSHKFGVSSTKIPSNPKWGDFLIVVGEGGAMLGLGASDLEFGVDPSADPELALALRVSMEEQRQRQEEEARRAAAASAAEAGIGATAGD
ncbi:PSMD4 ATPase, partial [Pomatorhinus ruficollis]|nr:PSMD4 ATPase [Pomatorhinus ruficollis]